MKHVIPVPKPIQFKQARLIAAVIKTLLILSTGQLGALENPQPIRPGDQRSGANETTNALTGVENRNEPLPALELQKEIFSLPSPVEKFRSLLTAVPAERDLLLAEYGAESRSRIVQKIQEYENLSTELRFNKLLATELRWYLPALLKFEKEERQELVQQLEPQLAQLILSRVAIWDQLPGSVKSSPDQKILIIRHLCKAASTAPPLPESESESESESMARKNEKATQGFQQPPTPVTPPMAPGRSNISQNENQRIQRLQLYFGLSAEEKKEMLKSVEASNDSSFLNRLQWLEAMPEGIRNHALRQLVRLQELSDQERKALGETLRAWNQLSAEQKSSLRQLLEKQPPSPGLMPIRSQN